MTDRMDEYVIRFSGLSIGTHQFKYVLDTSFFEAFENSEIRSGDFEVEVSMEKSERFLTFQLVLSGWLGLECDRCLQDFRQEISVEDNFLVKLTDKQEVDDERLVCLPEDAFEFNISRQLYEHIYLAIPNRRIHPDGGCNPEMLAHLADYLLVEEDEESKDSEDTDPRWNALKNLKLN